MEEKKPETPAQASPVPDQTASTTSEPAPAATEPSTETSPDATPEVQDATGGQAAPQKAGGEAPKKSSNGKIRNFISSLNLYLVLFIFIVIVAAVISAIAYLQGKKAEQKPTTQTQTLTPEKLKELSSNEIKVGDPKSLLTIESNTVFNGTTLIRGDLDVAGTIKVGGALSLPGISVSGKSTLDDVTMNQLGLSGDGTINGQLIVQKGLTVSGSANFAGPISAPSINIDRINLSGDLQISNHIDAGGSTPRVNGGTALGSGGTVSISGTDTAGTVGVNVGTGSPAGVLAQITFAKAFNGIPHVIITPVGSSAANIGWYVVSRTSTGFSIACVNAPSPSSFSFDFIVID